MGTSEKIQSLWKAVENGLKGVDRVPCSLNVELILNTGENSA